MKKIILTLIAVFTISINAMAFNIYIEGFGTYIGNYQAENQFGGGGGIFFGINQNFSIGIKGSYTTLTTFDSFKLKYNFDDKMILGGLQYNFQIANLPLFWSSFLGVGVEMMNITIPYMPGLSDMGPSIAINTGIRWDFHPHIAIFGNVGFHLPIFNRLQSDGGLKGWNIYGLTAEIGVRFAFWNNKPIDEQY